MLLLSLTLWLMVGYNDYVIPKSGKKWGIIKLPVDNYVYWRIQIQLGQ